MIARLENPSYTEFRDAHLIPNLPVLLGQSVASSWPVHKLWKNLDSTLNFRRLGLLYGDLQVSVLDCQSGDCDERPLRGLLELWENDEARHLYAKDVHLAKVIKAQGRSVEDELYTVPDLWKDDWMNEYAAAETDDDYRFVYIGGGDTFTAVHRDVYCSYSWSSNVHGRKRWTLFPPSPECIARLKVLLKTAEYEEGVVDVREWSKELREEFVKFGMEEVIQEEGESIFIPSGWYHQVENITHPCVSINHNWSNSHNLIKLYESLSDEVEAVRASISDVKELLQRSKPAGEWEYEWEECVSELTRQNAGWNWMTFWKMVRYNLGEIHPTSTSNQTSLARIFRPPAHFVFDIVEDLLSRFMSRSSAEYRWKKGLNDVLEDLRECVRLWNGEVLARGIFIESTKTFCS